MDRPISAGIKDQSTLSTQERLLAAAREVFARDGIVKATTREIARMADVNEVTLFRHFVSKERLLTAALADAVQGHQAALNEIALDMADLESGLLQFAHFYLQLLREHEAFFRILLAEGKYLSETTRKQIAEVGKPLRARLIQYLTNAQSQQLLRSFPVAPAADAFTGMLLVTILRHSAIPKEYSLEEYIQTSIALFLQGVKT